jgi:hypothetical protein
VDPVASLPDASDPSHHVVRNLEEAFSCYKASVLFTALGRTPFSEIGIAIAALS